MGSVESAQSLVRRPEAAHQFGDGDISVGGYGLRIQVAKVTLRQLEWMPYLQRINLRHITLVPKDQMSQHFLGPSLAQALSLGVTLL